jgi:hypothetical protein
MPRCEFFDRCGYVKWRQNTPDIAKPIEDDCGKNLDSCNRVLGFIPITEFGPQDDSEIRNGMRKDIIFD